MKVLFVCTGNTCRSPMAEVIFNKLCNLEEVCAKSAGLSVNPNSRVSENAALIIKEKYGVNLEHRIAVQLTKELVDEADIVLTMTEYIKNILVHYFPGKEKNIFSLNGYIGISEDIIDPYGGNKEVYTQTFEMLKSRIEKVINKMFITE